MASEQNLSAVIRQERGWPGHFVCADQCRFRRNTLLACGDVRIVVSTVGLMRGLGGCEEIGAGRYFETMAFHAQRHLDRYWDADVSREVSFASPWFVAQLDGDDIANDQHDAVVDEIARRMERGEFNITEDAIHAKNS